MEFQTNLKKLRTEEGLTQDQQIHIFNRFLLTFIIELCEEVFFDGNAEGIIDIIYSRLSFLMQKPV